MTGLQSLALHALHRALGAKMVPFAGYEMPVQYPMGVMGEHKHCRAKAGLFDVSHMGQVLLRGARYEAVARAFERMVPMDVLGLAPGRQRYGLFTNAAGGIEDDLMFANRGDHLFVVVNAACKAADIARMAEAMPEVTVEAVTGRALLALQGPLAEAALARLVPAVGAMRFMDVLDASYEGADLWISRSGYTGEDGFEISVPEAAADGFARALLAQEEVEPIGLGARDSLRLEAGLCLYGHDIDATTTPYEAGLGWAIQKLRRPDGARAGGFVGANAVFASKAAPLRKRVGLRPKGRAPMREGVALFATSEGGSAIGQITSGGFGPTVGGPVAMGYLPPEQAVPGTEVFGELRGKRQALTVETLPFVAAGFKR